MCFEIIWPSIFIFCSSKSRKRTFWSFTFNSNINPSVWDVDCSGLSPAFSHLHLSSCTMAKLSSLCWELFSGTLCFSIPLVVRPSFGFIQKFLSYGQINKTKSFIQVILAPFIVYATCLLESCLQLFIGSRMKVFMLSRWAWLTI